jgi:hypothetical protein
MKLGAFGQGWSVRESEEGAYLATLDTNRANNVFRVSDSPKRREVTFV